MTSIPLAMSPTQRTPGVALGFDLLAAASAVGSGVLRALVIAPKASGGTATANTLYQDVAGESAAAGLLQQGVPGHLACKGIFAELPLAKVDLIAPTAPSGANATGTFTFDDSQGSAADVTVAQTVTVWICGREITIAWLAGETREAAATKLVAALGALDADLPVTAANSSGTSNVCTVTTKLKGTWGNDVTTSVLMTGGTGGSVAASASKLASGATEIDISTALTAVSTREYDFILLVTSNADAISSSSSSNPARLAAHILAHGSGSAAKLQQGIVGCTGTLSGLKTATAAINFGQLQGVYCRDGQSLPCEWAAAELGARLRERALYAVKNRIHMLYKARLYGPKDHVTSDLSAVELEDALTHGITPVTFDATLRAWPERPVTMYYKDSGGNPDARILDVTRVDGIFEVAKDIRVNIPAIFAGKSLSPDIPLGDDEVPVNVVEIGTIRAFFCDRLRLWQAKGVLDKAELDLAIGTQKAPGTLICQIDTIDPTMVEVVIPLATIKPLAKFSIFFQQAA